MEARVGTGESDVTPEQINQFCQQVSGYFGNDESIGLKRKIFQSSYELGEGYQVSTASFGNGRELFVLKIDRYPEDEDMARSDMYSVTIDPSREDGPIEAKYKEDWLQKIDGTWVHIDPKLAVAVAIVAKEQFGTFSMGDFALFEGLGKLQDIEREEIAEFNEQMGLSRYGFTQLKFFEAMDTFERVDQSTDVTDQY